MEWIGVDDRLPHSGEWVLMYLNKYVGVDQYRAGFFSLHSWLSAADWTEDNYILNADNVTHWMPLPDPPEVDDETH